MFKWSGGEPVLVWGAVLVLGRSPGLLLRTLYNKSSHNDNGFSNSMYQRIRFLTYGNSKAAQFCPSLQVLTHGPRCQKVQAPGVQVPGFLSPSLLSCGS